MKTSFFLSLTFATLAFSLRPAHAAPPAPAKPTTNMVVKSVFTIPTNKDEGRDPFYPNSTRLWGAPLDAQPTSKPAQPSGVDCLVLKGLSGAVSNPLAMVNGRTMARGEDAEITTDCGRLLVHCVDITTNSVIVEVNGQRRELHLRSDL